MKEQIYDRNPDAFPSQHWFDPTNEFYLNRGYFWWYDTNDERCEWRRWSAFSVPIDANEGDLNAKEYNNFLFRHRRGSLVHSQDHPLCYFQGFYVSFVKT